MVLSFQYVCLPLHVHRSKQRTFNVAVALLAVCFSAREIEDLCTTQHISQERNMPQRYIC